MIYIVLMDFKKRSVFVIYAFVELTVHRFRGLDQDRLK